MLNYAPTVLGESPVPCLVLVKKITAPAEPNLEIYISNRWEEDIPGHHYEYISGMITDFLSRPGSDMDQILANAHNFSIGPLRLTFIGACMEEDLHLLLDEIFLQSGYSALT